VTLEVERKRAMVSGGEIAYVDLGEGPPLLLLHGYPSSSYLWRRETWLFAQRMRVIAPDLLGYGDSDKPEGADLTEGAQTGYVRELLAQLGIQELAVVGHDLGGAIAQMLALEGDLTVRTLVLLDSDCFDAWPIEGVKMLQAATPDQETEEFVEEVVRLAFDLGVAHKAMMEEADLDAYARPWMGNPAAFFRATRGLTGRGLAGREEELGALEQRVLIIWGEDDPYLDPELALRLGDILPGSTVALLPGCSHFVTEDAPQTVGPLIYEYLRTHYLGQSHHHGEPGGPVPVSLERPPRRSAEEE
jgi:2-hydroxymuconate-semialdehyde hydrolase